MFTRRHYTKIAASIAAARERFTAHKSPAVQTVGVELMDEWTRILADEFEQDNPNFDRTRFYSACGTIHG